MWKTNQTLTVLDIGSAKVCALIGRKTSRGVDIVGLGLSESAGLRQGQIVEIDDVARAVRAAIDEAELMASCEVSGVHLVASSGHVRSKAGHGLINIADGEVSDADIRRAEQAAQQPGPDPGHTLLHTLVDHFIVDNQHPCRDPLGRAGSRLEVQAHLLSAPTTALKNTQRACQRAGLRVDGMVLGAYASGESILTPREREQGVVLIDMGDASTDIAIWYGGTMVYAGSIALGGTNVTNDVGIGLRTTYAAAQHIKEYYGAALQSIVDHNEVVLVPGAQGHKAHRKSRGLLASIIEPRMEETFRFVRHEVEGSGYRDVLQSVVLTGGASTMPGVELVARRMLGLEVRLGTPASDIGAPLGGFVDAVRHPKYAAAVGVMQQIAEHGNTIAYREPQRRFDKRARRGIWDAIARLF